MSSDAKLIASGVKKAGFEVMVRRTLIMLMIFSFMLGMFVSWYNSKHKRTRYMVITNTYGNSQVYFKTDKGWEIDYSNIKLK